MSSNPRATMMKRQRELDQKDRAKQREARRAERRERAAARAASGQVGPEMGEPEPPLGDQAEPFRAPLAPQVSLKPTRLYVGNLSYDTTEESLRELFTTMGEVAEANLVLDRDSGRPRGFGFVTMGTPEAAAKAIRELNGQLVDGRPLTVNAAEEKSRSSGPRRPRY